MSYYKCPTCKTILANKVLLYDKMLESVCVKYNNQNTEEAQKEKREILDKLELHRMCCRMRMMTKVSLVKLIK